MARRRSRTRLLSIIILALTTFVAAAAVVVPIVLILSLLLSARCSLLAARYSLLAARCSLLVTRYSLLAARYSLLATRYSLLAARCSLPSLSLYQNFLYRLAAAVMVAQQLQAAKRLRKELQNLRKESNAEDAADDILLTCQDHLLKWKAWIRGPADTPYQGGVFELSIQCSTDYPLAPPTIKFVTKVCGSYTVVLLVCVCTWCV